MTIVLFEGLKVRLLGEGLYSEVFWVGQIINGRTDSFEIDWIKFIVDIPYELVGRLFIFPVLVCNIEVSNRMAVNRRILSVDQSIIAIDSNSPVIVRDREGKDPLMKLFLA